MIGALILRREVGKKIVANIESMDPKRVTGDYAEDVVMTFPGDPPVVGRAAAEAYFAKAFDAVAEEHITVKSVAVTRPYAIGITNTVLCEVELTAVMKDGRTVSGPEVYAMDVHGRTITAVRFYVGSPVWLETHHEIGMNA